MSVAAQIALAVGTLLLSAGAPKSAPTLVLELSKNASPHDHGTFPVVVRAVGKQDVSFNRAAVRVEIRPPAGKALKFGCMDKRDLTALIGIVQLHPGETSTTFIRTHCYHPEAGQTYFVTAVLKDDAYDIDSGESGSAIRVKGPIRSNTIVTRFQAAHNKPLQADGASRRR